MRRQAASAGICERERNFKATCKLICPKFCSEMVLHEDWNFKLGVLLFSELSDRAALASACEQSIFCSCEYFQKCKLHCILYSVNFHIKWSLLYFLFFLLIFHCFQYVLQDSLFNLQDTFFSPNIK